MQILNLRYNSYLDKEINVARRLVKTVLLLHMHHPSSIELALAVLKLKTMFIV